MSYTFLQELQSNKITGNKITGSCLPPQIRSDSLDGRTRRVLPRNDPLQQCLAPQANNYFRNGGEGGTFGISSQPCQRYLAQRCAMNWDSICEDQSNIISVGHQVTTDNAQIFMGYQPSNGNNLTYGERLIRNAAIHKYTEGSTSKCITTVEPFNPLVFNSPPLVTYRNCIPTFRVNAVTQTEFVNDRLLNKLSEKPYIGMDILVSILDNLINENKLDIAIDSSFYKWAMNTFQ